MKCKGAAMGAEYRHAGGGLWSGGDRLRTGFRWRICALVGLGGRGRLGCRFCRLRGRLLCCTFLDSMGEGRRRGACHSLLCEVDCGLEKEGKRRLELRE